MATAGVERVPRETDALVPQRGKKATPIFFENPDGTIAEAVPTSMQSSEKKAQARSSASADGGGLNAEVNAEVDYLYSRHERIFVLMLTVQLLVEILYDYIFVTRMDVTVAEVQMVYQHAMRRPNAQLIQPEGIERLLWIVFALHVTYGIAYYAIAVFAIATRRSQHFQFFANWCMAGIVSLIVLTYVDKFNHLLFFLRLLCYICARFLQGLTANLMLLPS